MVASLTALQPIAISEEFFNSIPGIFFRVGVSPVDWVFFVSSIIFI